MENELVFPGLPEKMPTITGIVIIVHSLVFAVFWFMGAYQELTGLTINSDLRSTFGQLLVITTALSGRELIPLFWVIVKGIYRSRYYWEMSERVAPITPTEHIQHYFKHHSVARPNWKGYVYLIRDIEVSQCYKIGRSKTPIQRMNDFIVLLPFQIEIIHLIPTNNMHQLESALHKRFAAKRVRGEWFSLNAEDVAYIQAIVSK